MKEVKKPEPIKNPDFTALIELCKKYLEYIASDEYHEDYASRKWKPYIYEGALDAIFGKQFWKYHNYRMDFIYYQEKKKELEKLEEKLEEEFDKKFPRKQNLLNAPSGQEWEKIPEPDDVYSFIQDNFIPKSEVEKIILKSHLSTSHCIKEIISLLNK